MQAQIKIGGNVYGGGNKGNTGGQATVHVKAGDLNQVYGGARMANVGGSAFVNIDGANMSGDILINYVYGGNDISGTVGTSTTVPTALTEKEANNIDNTYNAFVRTTPERKETSGTGDAATTSQPYAIFIGQLYGGGNGEYAYSETVDSENNYTVTDEETGEVLETSKSKFVKPELKRSYLEILGGTIAFLYGGGNNATITEKTDICINNTSTVTTSIPVGKGNTNDNLLLKDGASRLQAMGIPVLEGDIMSDEYQFSRVFGGNNKADMDIMPSWHLKDGKIRNLYSGGNEGRMIHNKGLLLEIGIDSKVYVDNVYGGCRKADVRPMEENTNGEMVDVTEVKNLVGYKFPNGLAARVLVRGGDVNNVYGGNDISGKVYGGNAVGVYTSIRGNIYGGGNGSYPYTDNPVLAGSLAFGDYYYDVNKILGYDAGTTITGLNSVKALNAFRPNAEQVSIRVAGQLDSNGNVVKESIIGGSIYCGGNSATLKKKEGVTNPLVELKVGSGVIADEVFLGNNGEEIVSKDVLARLAGSETYNGVAQDFSKINLLNADEMEEYMNAVAMDITPSVNFDDKEKGDPATYKPYTSTFGSFFCGGNVGSMTYEGTDQMDFSIPIYIYNKVVGGCNNAIVDEVLADNGQPLNARYEGGIIGTTAERVVNGGYSFTDASGNIKNRLVLKFGDGTNGGIQFLPKRWVDENDKSKGLEWNTWIGDEKVTALNSESSLTFTSDDRLRRFKEGHVYGGCYSSGVVNGNVVINLNSTIVDRDKLFDRVKEDELGEASLYGEDLLGQDNITYNILERRTGVILGQQGMDVLGAALNVFGGGKGKDTEIWGSTTINLSRGYTFQIFGGSEEGVIGRSVSSGGTYDFNGKSYKYDPKYSCTVNLCGGNAGVSKQEDQSEAMAETEFIYGGGFFGPICGNTIINLGKGRVFNTFAGSCMADILGHTETYIGRQVDPITGAVSEGFPYIRDIVYGGNDLGGRVLGEGDFTSRVRSTSRGDDFNAIGLVHNQDLLKASAYIEYLQGRADAIFGGCYGTYKYTDSKYGTYFNTDGTAKTGYTKPRMGNAFVNFRPTLTDDLKSKAYNRVNRVYGAGQGYPGDGDRDIMQRSSYVLIDIPQTMDDQEGINHYKHMEVFGGGAWSGLGMDYQDGVITPALFSGFTDNAKDRYSANIDLFRGQIGAAYGGSLSEGVVRRTEVNVPTGSTIKIGSIFGGAYGTEQLEPCDVIEANVEYHSGDALLVCDPLRTETETDEDGNKKEVKKGVEQLKGFIYGGNNYQRRTLYGRINIDVPVRQQHYEYNMTTATVYGAGCGSRTWSEYTEINLNSGASVYEVYGGGEAGSVMSPESVAKYYNSNPEGIAADKWKTAWTLGGGYDPASMNDYATHLYTSLNNPLVRTAEMDNRSDKTYKYNTNVIIKQGAYVGNYAYGGGYGKESDMFYGRSGDVYGTTYIALLGGRVNKDIYAAGTLGAVRNSFGGDFTASANAYIAGGMLRNVYGGGWKGDVGVHDLTTNETTDDVLGETNVVIGIRPDQTDADKLAEIQKVKGSSATLSDYGFLCGVPAIQRNAYSGGEGGAVFGTANLVLNNGYIGYVHLDANQAQDSQGNIVTVTTPTTERYDEKINDETYTEEGQWKGTGRLKDCGNMFGGGYDVRSSVDFSNVTIWNGFIRNSVHGGGEIATIGRGSTKEDGATRTLNAIYKPGKTNVTMYNGHVKHNVFGGGKGYNIWGYGAQGTLYTDGYVFGQTEVRIHGGEIGTVEGLEEGYGNVFGGGDIGYVYSGAMKTGTADAGSHTEGTGSPGHYYYKDASGDLTEDCKVVISPYLQVKTAGAIGGESYSKYDYVETDVLNKLPKKDKETGKFGGDWTKLFTGDSDGESERGVVIHNAVFGGGNVSSNSDTQYANATTIFGNTTATLYDVYHRDFITIGTEHTGGLYGGGNLSLVDGYRELNITNYGTDYYGLESQITLDQYRSLSSRERAYFQLQYVCTSDVNLGGTDYKAGDPPIKEEDYLKLVETYGDRARNAFTPYGFCSIYAGRLLNTIQRADLCGVYGSRMVLQGAKDRVADVGEKIDYTINRVGEVSLNQQQSVISSDTGSDAQHGNYFGIYSLVNYMGNLTSDVKFGDYYVNGDGIEERDKTYYSYKSANPTSSTRNKGTSPNQVALASGVFLELTTENSTEDHKDYGYITGIVELDLINVKQDQVGGGFVYAKNEHRVPKYFPNKKNVLLSEYNQPKSVGGTEIRDEARTYKRYYYTDEGLPTGAEATDAYVISGDDAHLYQTMVWETSGNFIHPSKRIVDDCYPTNNAYILGSDNYSEAHYWYVKGEVYIYDQKVSAYTGSATAYSKEVHLPLTITAASHGKLQLLNVKPNLYAYYTVNSAGRKVKIGTMDGDKELDKVWVNNDNDGYGLNEVVTWWDWHQMSPTDRTYFVTDTYVNTVACTIDGTAYEAGAYIMDATDLAAFKRTSHTIVNSLGDVLTDLDDLFRSSNNIGHDSGYVLTLDMNTPEVWSGANPTFTPLTSGIYGQRQIEVGDILTKQAVDNNTAGTGDQATVEPAYVAKEKVTYNYGGTSKTANAGTAISQTEWLAIGSPATFGPAYVCTQTVKLGETNYLLYGELKTREQIDEMKSGKTDKEKQEIEGVLTQAYVCSKAGGFGGQQLDADKKYPAVTTWCALPENDRFTTDAEGNDIYNFKFNYDALDLLADEDYLAGTSSGHGSLHENPSKPVTVEAFHSPYTDQVSVEYDAVFHAPATNPTMTVDYDGGTVSDGGSLTNAQFETVRNDKRHYTHVSVASGGETIYFATENFIYNGMPYGRGQVVSDDVANNNGSKVESKHFNNTGSSALIQYYCYEDYDNGSKGSVISESEYAALPNYQQYFVIQGKEPTETTTLYVSSESDIKDVMSERVYSVVYQYTYYEDEDDGSIKLTNELHVINIHLELESGVPSIGTLYPPATVLPGDAVGLTRPEVQPGLYEVLTSGWELFDNETDALRHRNGEPFVNNDTPVFWYQNQKSWVAFYSKTYLGKTYSNPVKLSVANYHDLDRIMQDKEHHLYVDHPDVDRASKIYIDNRTCQSDASKSELDLLKDFFDLSVGTASSGTTGHAPLDSHVKGCQNLEFFLRSNVSPKSYTEWTPIGDDTQCFKGNLHGDGYSVNGLKNSLFGKLCGSVYNLGVSGSFTSAGIADMGDGYVENCWVKTSGTPVSGTHPVFGNPTDEGFSQVVNCYYMEDAATPLYTPFSDGRNTATKMSSRSFYNGEVAYNLNGFYLNKRYCDATNQTAGTAYSYYTADSEGNLTRHDNGHYVSKPALCSSGYNGLKYVEDRFADGDFIYAGGSVPDANDRRLYTIGEGTDAVSHYAPIWPDDYIFFGQALNYGHVDGRTHQDNPSHINKTGDFIQTDVSGNRVYRAPAYYQSKQMGVAYFNPAAVFAQSKAGDASTLAYKGMTAIDFSGYNDVKNGYKQGWNDSHFYQPLLDDGGLSGFQNIDLTKNLLAYTSTATEAAAITDAVVSTYLHDQQYEETDDNYRTVGAWDRYSNNVHGHWVQLQSDGSYKALLDHMLVDRQDFNAPISYKMDDDMRMWYQREPDRYVDLTKGWEDVSLPFTADIVTTQQKGELTHFFDGSTTGHEYWLRLFDGNLQPKEGSTGVYAADFNYPAAGTGDDTKRVTNTFLWDYYYYETTEPHHQDYNKDTYRTYYNETRLYDRYPRLKAATPYIIGFPGTTYYEFDLSGNWSAVTTASPNPAKLDRQVITFASATGEAIRVSDDETAEAVAANTKSGLSYHPSYLNREVAVGDYVLNSDGNAYVQTTTAGASQEAFRPYFTGTASSGVRSRGIEQIIFGMGDGSFGVEDRNPSGEGGTLIIRPGKRSVIVTSALRYVTDVAVINTAGITLRTFTIEPGQTVETPVNNAGVYIVRTEDGLYTKKQAVR